MAITLDAIGIEDISAFYPNDRNIQVFMLRLDKADKVISGNKYFKLRYNLKSAVAAGFRQIITFGGAYSNHLVATAAAANDAGLHSIGVVRGFHAEQQLTATLKACIGYGMQLHFVSREDYKRKDEPDFLAQLTDRLGTAFIIPEGGDNELGRKGTEDIAAYIPGSMTHVCLPAGTGTTFSGIRSALHTSASMIGFTAMKGGQYLAKEIALHLNTGQNTNWHLEDRFHFGGFAKTTNELIRFMQDFYQATTIPLDIVYTGKMMFGIGSLLQTLEFPKDAHILAIHTGGLQGNPANLFQQ